MDGNAKARIWAHLKGYNRTHRQKGQHIGPYTRTMLDVIQTMLFGFHNADGTGRCFPSYKTIAKVANCSDDSVERAINTAEKHGHLTWVHRIVRVWREEPDLLLGGMRRVRQINRTSNGYRFFDPLEREPGRNGYKPQNPGRPINQAKTEEGARLAGARVIQEELPQPPLVPQDRPAIAPQREHGMVAGVLRPRTELAALVARQDAGLATAADWRAYERAIAAMLLSDRLHQ
jgi:hypothetical protein